VLRVAQQQAARCHQKQQQHQLLQQTCGGRLTLLAQQQQQQQHLLQVLTCDGPLHVLVVLLSPHLTAGLHWAHLLPAHPPAQLAARWCGALQQQTEHP
jgi:hypothetical protein